MLAFATPPLGTPLPPVPGAEPGPPDAAPVPLSFVRSVMPALDRAFGVEHEAAFPEAIAGLVERLCAGPLGDVSAVRPAASVD